MDALEERLFEADTVCEIHYQDLKDLRRDNGGRGMSQEETAGFCVCGHLEHSHYNSFSRQM